MYGLSFFAIYDNFNDSYESLLKNFSVLMITLV